MKQPFAVKVIKVLAWVGVLASLLFISFIIYADSVRTPTSDAARGIREGGLKALGFPNQFSTFEAYEAIGHFLPPALLLVFILRSISKRKILLFRIAATILLFAGIAFRGVPFIIIGVLAWLPPVTRYLKSGEPPG